MSNIAFLLPLVIIVIGLIVLWLVRRKREQLHIPEGKVIYQDTQEKPGSTLYSPTYGLKGRPDFLFQQDQQIIPVEEKTGRTPKSPYYGHIMQLIAYCVLVEENYHVRPAYGIIRYSRQQFRIEFTEQRRVELTDILSQMREKRGKIEIHRNHTNPRVCIACGFRDYCDEKFAEQLELPLEN